MIPTMIIVGLVLGLVPQHGEHRTVALAVFAVLSCLAFGLAVGEVLGGSVLAFVNVAVGVILGSGIQRLVRGVQRA